MKTIRYTTLLRDYGPIVPAKAVGNWRDWQLFDKRIITVPRLRGPRSKAPGIARVGDEVIGSTLCQLLAARPIEAGVTHVEGLTQNADALAVIEWALRLNDHALPRRVDAGGAQIKGSNEG